MPGLKGRCWGIRLIEDSDLFCVNCKGKIIIPKQVKIHCDVGKTGGKKSDGKTLAINSVMANWPNIFA